MLPGGESTAIFRQLERSGLTGELKAAAISGKPILATCAGLVLVSKEIDGIEGDGRVKPLGLMDIKISRNAFGPQRESFEADLEIVGMDRPYRAVFIRAPAIAEVGHGVQVLAKVGDAVVAARQKNLLALAFHPELTDDSTSSPNILEDAGGLRCFRRRIWWPEALRIWPKRLRSS